MAVDCFVFTARVNMPLSAVWASSASMILDALMQQNQLLLLCRKTYHLPCGLEHGSLQQFFGNYESYCETHKPAQEPFLPKNKNKVEMFAKKDECGCCTMELEVRRCPLSLFNRRAIIVDAGS